MKPTAQVLQFMEQAQSNNLETMIFSMGQVVYATKLPLEDAQAAVNKLLKKGKLKHLIPHYIRGTQPRIWYVLTEEIK